MDECLSAASAHRVTHRRAPTQWRDGLPLGNGDLGVMFWGDGNPLCLTLDKSDLWDLRSNDDYQNHPDFSYESLCRLVREERFDEVDEIFEQRQRRDNPLGPVKISVGRTELDVGEATEYECRLDLGTATVEGTIGTAEAEHTLKCFVHRHRNVICLQVAGASAETSLALLPLMEMNEALQPLAHPEPQRLIEDDVHVLTQQVPEGPAYAVVWNERGPAFLMVIESADSVESARTRAMATWQEASAVGFDTLLEEHVRAWQAFWWQSAVYLPEERMEFLWYYGLYLLASSARRGCLPPGLQGLWAMDGVLPAWRGDYHADMNVQETFWPALASGHLDLLDCWIDFMLDCQPAAQDFTRRLFGTEGAFWTCAFLPRYTIVTGWHTVQYALSHGGWLAWMVWQRWRYSMDVAWLRETGYPLVAEIFRLYRGVLVEEADGHLHVPVSTSPEYKDNKPEAWCKDPNMDLALIRRTCDWVVEMEQALGDSDLTPSAREVHDKLVPYHVTEGKVLCLWADKPLDESHRHPSHLMPIHPAMDLTIDGGDETRAIIDASLEQYFSLGQYYWAGHTYAQMASFAAVVGRAEFAYDCLLRFAEYWVGPNGLHFNRDTRYTGSTAYRGEDCPFTIEASCGIAAGISDMLVQGWNDVVRVFPAVPDHWRDVAFRDLLTEGAFRVSAIRRDGKAVWVRIRAGVDRQLRLRDPFGKQEAESKGANVVRDGDLLVADMQAGDELTIGVCGFVPDLADEATRVRSSGASRLGLR